MSVNYFKSIERMIENAVENSSSRDVPGFNKAAYQLGYMESCFATFMHQVEFELGVEKTKRLMEGLYMPIVHSSGSGVE